MKRGLAIDAEMESNHGTLLLQLVLALRERQIEPESLVWSRPPNTNLARLWLVLPSGREDHLQALVELLGEIPGVSKITLL